MYIQKVLNSSVVLVQDDSGEESILLGKGIGYGRKAGEPIERQPSDRVFLPLSNPDAQPMLDLNRFQRKKNKNNHRKQPPLSCNLFRVIFLREKPSTLLHFPCRQNTIIIHCQLQK